MFYWMPLYQPVRDPIMLRNVMLISDDNIAIISDGLSSFHHSKAPLTHLHSFSSSGSTWIHPMAFHLIIPSPANHFNPTASLQAVVAIPALCTDVNAAVRFPKVTGSVVWLSFPVVLLIYLTHSMLYFAASDLTIPPFRRYFPPFHLVFLCSL